jgi:hypothetical protein
LGIRDIGIGGAVVVDPLVEEDVSIDDGLGWGELARAGVGEEGVSGAEAAIPFFGIETLGEDAGGFEKSSAEALVGEEPGFFAEAVVFGLEGGMEVFPAVEGHAGEIEGFGDGAVGVAGEQ